MVFLNRRQETQRKDGAEEAISGFSADRGGDLTGPKWGGEGLLSGVEPKSDAGGLGEAEVNGWGHGVDPLY